MGTTTGMSPEEEAKVNYNYVCFPPELTFPIILYSINSITTISDF